MTACWVRRGRWRTAGYTPDQGMGIGIDGSRACDAFGSRQAIGIPRHDVAQLGQPRRASPSSCCSPRSRTRRRCRAVLHRSRATSPPRTSNRTTRPSSASRPTCDATAPALSEPPRRPEADRHGPGLDSRTAPNSSTLEQALESGSASCRRSATYPSAFAPARLLALVGENGAGKSTLMRLLEGVFTAGQRRHFDRWRSPIIFVEPREAMPPASALSTRNRTSSPNLTVAENIFVGDMPRRLGRPSRLAHA